MLTQLNHNSQGTFSTMKIATGLMTTALLIGNTQIVDKAEDKPSITLKCSFPEKSYQETKFNESLSSNEQLTVALQGVYENLLTNQKELDIETKQLIYQNLWDLYT